MPRYQTCDHYTDSGIFEVYECGTCKKTWCVKCGDESGICPSCSALAQRSVTLSEEAYL